MSLEPHNRHKARDKDDDDLDPSLPPLDGGADEDATDPADAADDGDEVDVPADGDPFDDAAFDAEPVDDLDMADEASWVGDSEQGTGEDTLDVADLAGGTNLLEDNDEPGVGDEDFGLGGEETDRGQDAGEEGPTEEDEELREGDLPALDADEDGEVGAETLFEPMTVDDEPPLPWDRAPWEGVGAPVQVGPVIAIACAGQGVVATLEGGGLVRVDLEGGVAPIAEMPVAPNPDRTALAAAGQAIADRARTPVDVTAAAGADNALFATIYSRAEGRSWLVRVHDGEPTLVAEVGAPQRLATDEDAGDAQVTAIAWDATRGVVWVAGSFGVVAFAPR